MARMSEARIGADLPESEREVVATQVAAAALKFGDLANHRTSNYVFDLDRFTALEGKTGPYLQYAAVRLASILRKASDAGLRGGSPIAPTTDAERGLVLRLATVPEIVLRAWDLRAPNHVAETAYEIAGAFNRFYEQSHILGEEDPVRQASWLTLVETTLAVLTRLLDLLGIRVPDRM
jgi:arginyl-tRNA synthetase